MTELKPGEDAAGKARALLKAKRGADLGPLAYRPMGIV
jgi:hypothetical protein